MSAMLIWRPQYYGADAPILQIAITEANLFIKIIGANHGLSQETERIIQYCHGNNGVILHQDFDFDHKIAGVLTAHPQCEPPCKLHSSTKLRPGPALQLRDVLVEMRNELCIV